MTDQHTAYLNAIHAQMVRVFNLPEIKDLCFRLGLSADDIPGGTRNEKTRELILLLDRIDRLDDLKARVLALRPHVVWPQPPAGGGNSGTDDQPAPPRWQLQGDDRQRLITLLITRPELRTEDRRDAFIEEMLAGSPCKTDIQGQINLGGPPRQFAGHLLTVLTQFGKDEPGQEVLGRLVNHLLPYLGDGPEKAFLLGLFDKYPLQTSPVSTRGLTAVAWRGREQPGGVQEKIIGENTLRDIGMLELALEAARSVVRIDTTHSLGSGFLAGPNLIMTNNHVIGSAAAALPSAFQFNFQLDRRRQPLPVRAARAKPGGLFYTNPDLDVTVVEVDDAPADVAPLALARRRVLAEQRVNIIQHPGGHYKKISMQNNFVAYADARDIQYLTSTEPGSSGSPVLDNDFVVVGIHHSGGEMPEPGSGIVYLRNAGSAMTAVLDDLQANAPEIYQRLHII